MIDLLVPRLKKAADQLSLLSFTPKQRSELAELVARVEALLQQAATPK